LRGITGLLCALDLETFLAVHKKAGDRASAEDALRAADIAKRTHLLGYLSGFIFSAWMPLSVILK